MTTAADNSQAPDMLAAALSLAAQGFRVIPLHVPIFEAGGKVTCSCRGKECWLNTKDPDQRGDKANSVGKHPRILKWGEEATTDPEQVRHWWGRMWPGSNIGIVAGQGLAIIDVDPRNGGDETLELLAEELGPLPSTVQAISGGGGPHFYLRSETPLPCAKLGPGIDVQAGTTAFGQVVAPPSLHHSGRRYTWEASSDPADGVTPADLPQRWVERILNGAAARGAGAEQVDPDEPIREGDGGKNGKGRKAWFVSRGRSMWATGFSKAEIRAALEKANERTNPPLTKHEFERMLEYIFRVPAGRSKEWQERAAKFRVVNGGADENDGGGPGEPPPPSPGSAGPAPRPAAGRMLHRGDSVELAQLLLVDLQGDSTERIVFDRHKFWRYAAERGVWEALEEHAIKQVVATYAGRIKPGPKGPMPLQVNAGTISGAVEVASSLSARPGFFNDAPAGIVFRNGFATVCDQCGPFLQPHSPLHRAIHALPYDYDPSRLPTRWLRYLAEVFTYPGEEHADAEQRAAIEADRADRIALLQEFVGVALLGLATRFAICLVLTGEGNNGKSVFLRVVKALFPWGATVSIAPQLWENRFYLAELASARLNAVAELPEREIHESETFKAVISGDSLMVAKKNKDPFDLQPTAAHLVACNALPSTRDQTEGFWRRFTVVPFDRQFAEYERDLDLADRLLNHELAGVAAWALEGAGRAIRRGRYTIPDSSAYAKDQWQRATDIVRQFAEDAVPGMIESRPLRRITATELYKAFVVWVREHGHAALSSTKFGKRVKSFLAWKEFEDGTWYTVRPAPEGWRVKEPTSNPPAANARDHS